MNTAAEPLGFVFESAPSRAPDVPLPSNPCLLTRRLMKPPVSSKVSDNGSSYISGDLAELLQDQGMKHSRDALSSPNPWQDRALASDFEEPHPAGELLPAG